MKHKLSPAEREARIDRRAAARAAKTSRREAVRGWFDDRRAKADEARREKAATLGFRAKKDWDQPGLVVTPKQLVEHTDDNYATRRARAKANGQRITVHGHSRLAVRAGSNQPYVNPGRDSKRPARLRAELR